MSDSNDIIIVSGLPRSGTSLMMQMLHAGGVPAMTDELRTADEDNPKGYFEFEKVKKIRDDKSWLPAARGKAIKMISMLLYDLPDSERYRIIFMRRDLDEIVVSQEKMLIRRRITPPDRTVIKSAFSMHLEKVFRWIATQPTIQLIEVDYRNLVTDPAPAVQSIAAFLPVEIDTTRMLTAVDPSLYRNKEDLGFPR